jgi:hypothetical protein
MHPLWLLKGLRIRQLADSGTVIVIFYNWIFTNRPGELHFIINSLVLGGSKPKDANLYPLFFTPDISAFHRLYIFQKRVEEGLFNIFIDHAGGPGPSVSRSCFSV